MTGKELERRLLVCLKNPILRAWQAQAWSRSSSTASCDGWPHARARQLEGRGRGDTRRCGRSWRMRGARAHAQRAAQGVHTCSHRRGARFTRAWVSARPFCGKTATPTPLAQACHTRHPPCALVQLLGALLQTAPQQSLRVHRGAQERRGGASVRGLRAGQRGRVARKRAHPSPNPLPGRRRHARAPRAPRKTARAYTANRAGRGCRGAPPPTPSALGGAGNENGEGAAIHARIWFAAAGKTTRTR